MRVATLSLLAAPALVAAHIQRQHHHHNRQFTVPLPFLGTVTFGGPDASSSTTSPPVVPPTTTPAPPVSSVSEPVRPTSPPVPPSSSSLPPSSSSSAPPTSSSPPTSSAPPSSSSSSSAETSSLETSSEPPVQPSSEAPTSSTAPSSAQPSVIYKTVTEANGQTSVETSIAGQNPSSKAGISTGAIAGIAVGAAAVLAILAGVLFWLLRRGRHDEDEAIRWPELNRHGDASVVHALPVSQHGVNDRRMSLGSDLDGPSYQTDESAGGPAVAPSNYHGSNAHYSDEQHFNDGYEYEHNAAGHGAFRQTSPSYGEHDDYTNLPPAVQPQPSPVHGVQGYEWDADTYPHDQYPSMQRQSPPMAGIGSAVSFPQPQNHGHY